MLWVKLLVFVTTIISVVSIKCDRERKPPVDWRWLIVDRVLYTQLYYSRFEHSDSMVQLNYCRQIQILLLKLAHVIVKTWVLPSSAQSIEYRCQNKVQRKTPNAFQLRRLECFCVVLDNLAKRKIIVCCVVISLRTCKTKERQKVMSTFKTKYC